MNKVIKTADLMVYREDLKSISLLDNYCLGLAITERNGEIRYVVGLCEVLDAHVEMTHMCYYVDSYFNYKKISERKDADRFVFDAGTTCPAVWSTREDFLAAYQNLEVEELFGD